MIAAEKSKIDTPTGNHAYQLQTPTEETMIQEEGFEKIVQEVMRRIRLQEQEKEEVKWLIEHPEFTW